MFRERAVVAGITTPTVNPIGYPAPHTNRQKDRCGAIKGQHTKRKIKHVRGTASILTEIYSKGFSGIVAAISKSLLFEISA